MATSFPQTLYACPCSVTTSVSPNSIHSKRASRQETIDEEGEEHTFNPHHPSANYALNPLENLLFCDECNIIRCSRCWAEEIIYWYCPNCLFEVPSSGVKSDGNRCTRHCYNCPMCTASLSVTAINKPADNTYLKPGETSSTNESYMLFCQYCEWSSLDIGVQLNKPTKITEQLNKLRKARTHPQEDSDAGEVFEREPSGVLSHDDAFKRLSNFYKEQLSESTDNPNPYATSPYSSPANLARIMSLYGGLSYNALKKSREKPQPMREAADLSEGLVTYTADECAPDDEAIEKLRTLGISGTTTEAQRLASPLNFDARFTSDLWPVATPLRARRGKRCRTCRQFLARPEPKVGSMRYKIRLIALNHIQRLSIRPFPSASSSSSSSSSFSSSSFPALKPELPDPSTNNTSSSSASIPASVASSTPSLLQPGQVQQYILTVRNPVFETVRVTLATPALTPGRVASRVTILCPTFTVGPAGDVWDEALSSSTASAGGGAPAGQTTAASDGGRRAAMASLTGVPDGGDRQPEAGKVWERSRNSTSVVVEVVPGTVPTMSGGKGKGRAGEDGEEKEESVGLGAEGGDEDLDVLEIPIYVRAEWEAEPHADVAAATTAATTPAAASAGGERKGEKESKELAYWCVLGLGRIARG